MKQSDYGFIQSDNFITVIADKPYTLTSSDGRFEKARELARNKNWKAFFQLVDKPAAIARYTRGKVRVVGNEVFYDGVAIHGLLVNRILKFLDAGEDFEPLVLFLENLYKNTDENVRNRLYTFLENNHLAITERGSFLAFKLVKQDGSPVYHYGQIMLNGEWVNTYEVGNTYTYPKDRIVKTNGECSTEGIYVGNRMYWNGNFDENQNYNGEGKMLIAEIYPQDVENIPHADATKIVVSKMRVIAEYPAIKNKVENNVYKDSNHDDGIINEDEFDSEFFNDAPVVEKILNINLKKNVKLPKRDKHGRFIPRKKIKRDRFGRFV